MVQDGKISRRTLEVIIEVHSLAGFWRCCKFPLIICYDLCHSVVLHLAY